MYYEVTFDNTMTCIESREGELPVAVSGWNASTFATFTEARTAALTYLACRKREYVWAYQAMKKLRKQNVAAINTPDIDWSSRCPKCGLTESAPGVLDANGSTYFCSQCKHRWTVATVTAPVTPRERKS